MNTIKIPKILLTCLLAGTLSAEVFPEEEDFDGFGGYLPVKGSATGRFHLEYIDNRHFLITPDGHGFLSIGVTHTGAVSRTEHQSCNYLHDVYDGDWNKVNDAIVAQFSDWGYNSIGYDSHESTRKLYPYFADCYPTMASAWRGKGIQFPDVFSDAWKQVARQAVEQMVQENASNPNLIGMYWTDIPAWDFEQARQGVGKTWVDAIRELPDGAPGKVRYKQFIEKNGENASDEDFLVLIAREVYSFIGPLTRQLAPDTLIFGERYAAWRMPWRVIQEALPYIDVVSIQPVDIAFTEETYERLHRETGKPIMICDHQVSFPTPEHASVMWNSLPDATSVGQAHQKYMESAFSKPYLIGYNRCQYIDRYKHDLGLLKQGLLQVDGTPYSELVKFVKASNWAVHERFLGE